MPRKSAKQVCKAKRYFQTEELARDYGVRYNHSPYKCPVCNGWHLTSGAAGKLTKLKQFIFKPAVREWISRKTRGRKPR
jgi:hypothetical protein